MNRSPGEHGAAVGVVDAVGGAMEKPPPPPVETPTPPPEEAATLETVTLTDDVAVFPAASDATAEMAWLPFPTVVESQVIE